MPRTARRSPYKTLRDWERLKVGARCQRLHAELLKQDLGRRLMKNHGIAALIERRPKHRSKAIVDAWEGSIRWNRRHRLKHIDVFIPKHQVVTQISNQLRNEGFRASERTVKRCWAEFLRFEASLKSDTFSYEPGR